MSELFLLKFNDDSTKAKVVCYHGTWARYRSGKGSFQLSNIDTSLCTHLIYSFVGMSTEGNIVTLDSYLDYDLDNLRKFNALKSSNSNLKTLVAIGGWNEGSVKFSTVAASASLRSTFVQSAVDFCKTYNFDGLDFDWEYPAQRGGSSDDKQNYIALLKETKAAFEANGLLVSAAVAAGASSVSLSYDVPNVSKYVDFINVMAYDLHASWDGVLGHNAPLYASSVDTTAASLQLNVDAVITNWIALGADPGKLILGIPLYGRSFTLSSTSNVAIGAPSSGAGTAGPYTQEAGYLGYNEIVEKQLEGGWTYVWDDEQQVPHIYKGDQWVGFDDPKSVQLKTKYAQDKKLGGVMVWALETEDFQGLSGVKNPLLRATNEQLGTSSLSDSSSNNDATTAETTTTTTVATNSAAQSSNDNINSKTKTTICSEVGYVRDSSDCTKFYYCSANASGSLVAAEFTCSGDTYFDTTSNVCNWKTEVTGCD